VERNGTGTGETVFFFVVFFSFRGRRRVLGFFPPLGGEKTQKQNPPTVGRLGKGSIMQKRNGTAT
jgi:hypothetical protein